MEIKARTWGPGKVQQAGSSPPGRNSLNVPLLVQNWLLKGRWNRVKLCML